MPTALEPEVFARLQKAVRRMTKRFPNPDRAQTSVAKILGVIPSTVSRLLQDPGTGGSLTMIQRAAEYLNDPIETILFGTAPKQPVRKLRELPGFEEAMADALRRVQLEHPTVTREDLEVAADTRATPEPESVGAGLLIQLALLRRNRS